MLPSSHSMSTLFRRGPIDHDAIGDRLRALAPEPALRFESHRAINGPGPCVVAEGACPTLTRTAMRPRVSTLMMDVLGLETDDPAFDSRFGISGPTAVVHAVLDDTMRAALLALSARPGVLELAVTAGELQVFVSATACADAGFVEEVAAAALRLVAELGAPADVPARLARNARESVLRAVRERQLRTLVRHHPESGATRDALRAAITDPDAEVRLLAGRGLGDEGRPVLRALAAAEDTVDTIASRAVDALAGRLTIEDAAALLGRGPLLARSCLASLVRAVTDGRVATGAVEPAIAGALARSEAAVRAAAIDALGRIGGASAVEPLANAAEREDDDLAGAARRAIAAIQSRLVGADHGQISLADGASGQVSVVATNAGDLSLPERATDAER
jgi:HEAT repeat protein